MSLVLEKVSKVLSCEIRAQAKKILHVSHFKFIKTTFVLLTYLFPFSRKAYNLSAPPRRGCDTRARRGRQSGAKKTNKLKTRVNKCGQRVAESPPPPSLTWQRSSSRVCHFPVGPLPAVFTLQPGPRGLRGPALHSLKHCMRAIRD